MIQSGVPGNCWKNIPQMYRATLKSRFLGIDAFDPERPYFEIEINYLIGRQNSAACVYWGWLLCLELPHSPLKWQLMIVCCASRL
jgi:hypothetical protein